MWKVIPMAWCFISLTMTSLYFQSDSILVSSFLLYITRIYYITLRQELIKIYILFYRKDFREHNVE